MKPSRRERVRVACRRLMTATALASYLLAAFGFPVAVRAREDGRKDVSLNFSCAAGVCGCAVEEKVRESCCCSVKTKQQLACCAPVKKKSCCSDPEPAARVTWAIGEKVRECSGHSTTWLASGFVVTLTPTPALERPAATGVHRHELTQRRRDGHPQRDADVPRRAGADTQAPVSTGERSAFTMSRPPGRQAGG